MGTIESSINMRLRRLSTAKWKVGIVCLVSCKMKRNNHKLSEMCWDSRVSQFCLSFENDCILCCSISFWLVCWILMRCWVFIEYDISGKCFIAHIYLYFYLKCIVFSHLERTIVLLCMSWLTLSSPSVSTGSFFPDFIHFPLQDQH